MGSLGGGEAPISGTPIAPLYGAPIREDPCYRDPPLQTVPALWVAAVKEDPPVTGRPFPAQMCPGPGVPPRCQRWGLAAGSTSPSIRTPAPSHLAGGVRGELRDPLTRGRGACRGWSLSPPHHHPPPQRKDSLPGFDPHPPQHQGSSSTSGCQR